LFSLVEKDENIKNLFVKILKDKGENERVRSSVAIGLSWVVEKDESIKKLFVEILKDKGENEEVRGRVAINLRLLVEKDESIKKLLDDIDEEDENFDDFVFDE